MPGVNFKIESGYFFLVELALMENQKYLREFRPLILQIVQFKKNALSHFLEMILKYSITGNSRGNYSRKATH